MLKAYNMYLNKNSDKDDDTVLFENEKEKEEPLFKPFH
jgi:hypothetical protein